MTVLMWTIAGVAAGQVACGWLAWCALKATARVERKLAHHHDALALLAETSESGFDAVAQEITRSAAARSAPARKPSTRRLSAAAKRGAPIQEIAAAEQLSEGEVRLRLQMAPQRPKRNARRTAVQS